MKTSISYLITPRFDTGMAWLVNHEKTHIADVLPSRLHCELLLISAGIFNCHSVDYADNENTSCVDKGPLCVVSKGPSLTLGSSRQEEAAGKGIRPKRK